VELPHEAGHAASALQLGWVQLAGLMCSLALALPFCVLEIAQTSSFQLSLFGRALELGVLSAALGALLSDLPGGPLLGCRPPRGCFCCGNWGLMVPREALADKCGGQNRSLFPKICSLLLEAILQVVELRGGQAGGVMTFVGESGGSVTPMRARVVKSKRGHLPVMIFRRFRKIMSRQYWKRLFCCRRRLKPMPVIVAQGHSRFGTSSQPAEIETHPHQWLAQNPVPEIVWRCDVETGAWSREETKVCVTITHNGDFDAWEIYGSALPNGILGEWLTRVLECSNPALGDSPKLAGVMDLLVCQGRWLASVRYAFVSKVMQHATQASGWSPLVPGAPKTMPPPAFFKTLALAFDREFAANIDKKACFAPSDVAIESLAVSVFKALGTNGNASLKKTMSDWDLSGQTLKIFCSRACQLFFTYDTLTAVSEFFKAAEGTFGISVTCNLWPTSIVLAAKGQPISLAFNPELPLAMWASEPGSLNVPWPSLDGKPAVAKRVANARWDLDDAGGEAVELKVFEQGSAQQHINSWALGNLPGGLPTAHFFATPDMDATQMRNHHILVRGVTLGAEKEVMTETSFRRRWVHVHARPFSVAVPKGFDPISRDLRDCPAVLADIELAWTDRSSLNYSSGQNFANCLAKLLERPPHSTIDVLIIGVESSLWLGQQFAADLKRMYPRLNITAVSSNWVLGILQKAQGHVEPRNFTINQDSFMLTPGAIFLALSHSGTTYPTVWASRLVTRQAVRINGFAMSADFDTVLANSIGQDLTEPTFSGSLFSTMAGVRPSEPSTVATLAMHHTLSWLLVTCAKWTCAVFTGANSLPDDPTQPCATRLTEALDAVDFEKTICTLLPATEQIVGYNRMGKEATSPIYESLQLEGRYLGSHLLEGWYSTFLMCAYVYITVTFGVPIFSAIWRYGVLETVFEDDDDSSRVGLQIATFAVGHLDAHLYVFLAVLMALLHRVIAGRRLWTRFTARTFVVVDCTVNYKLLRAFGSKLGSLAFPFTAFKVAGQNAEDHFVHEMTHLAQSDAILLIGRPDGRLGALSASEAAVVMSTQQARYICSRPSRGVEAISIGHNPWAKAGLFRKQVVLPSNMRPLFLSQKLLQTHDGGHAPGDVMGKIAALLNAEKEDTSASSPFDWVNMEVLNELIEKKGLDKHALTPQQAEALMKDLIAQSKNRLSMDVEKVTEKVSMEMSAAIANGPLFESATTKGHEQHDTPSKQTDHSGSKAVAATSVLAHLKGREVNEQFQNAQTEKVKQQMGASPGTGESVAKQVNANHVKASKVLALMRGRAMQDQINQLRFQKQKDDTKMQTLKIALASFATTGLKTSWDAWCWAIQQAKQETLDGKTVSALEANDGGLASAAWRVREEFRRRKRGWMTMMASGDAIACICFAGWVEIWKGHAGRDDTPASPGQQKTKSFVGDGSERKGEDGSAVVGAHLCGKITDTGKLLERLRTLEFLYETRVASAERLIAGWVLMHKAVRPISKLWWLSYDMDRSESRLRVASTPAPVPFVEGLPPTCQEVTKLSHQTLVEEVHGNDQVNSGSLS
jgi:hypothetical protein